MLDENKTVEAFAGSKGLQRLRVLQDPGAELLNFFEVLSFYPSPAARLQACEDEYAGDKNILIALWEAD